MSDNQLFFSWALLFAFTVLVIGVTALHNELSKARYTACLEAGGKPTWLDDNTEFVCDYE